MLYASYNSIILIPVLVSVKKYIQNTKMLRMISIFSAIGIILLSTCIFSLLLRGEFLVAEMEMPLLEITRQFGVVFQWMYSCVIIVSIFTSAISTGYSFLKNVSKDAKKYQRNIILMSITGILISNIGFSKLVEVLYPLFGVLGLIQIVLLYIRKSH